MAKRDSLKKIQVNFVGRGFQLVTLMLYRLNNYDQCTHNTRLHEFTSRNGYIRFGQDDRDGFWMLSSCA